MWYPCGGAKGPPEWIVILCYVGYRIKNQYKHHTSVVAGNYAARPPQLNHAMSRPSNSYDTTASHVTHIPPSAPVESVAPPADNHVITLSTILADTNSNVDTDTRENKFCGNCGSPSIEGNKYCIKCGSRL